VWRKELRELGAGGRFHWLETRDLATWDAHADWYFVHFDVVLAWQTKLQGLRPCCVIVDEAHSVKNGRTQRGKGVYAVVAPAPRKFLLTGTPVENKTSDLWHLLTMLTGPYTWGSPLAFRQRYCGAQHDGYGYCDGDPTHVDELRQRIELFYLRRTATEVGLNLPALTRQLESVQLTAALQDEHNEVLAATDVAALVQAIQSGAVKDKVLETLTRLRHLTSVGKIPATVEYVRNAQEQGEGVVVFVWERNTAMLIAQAIKGSFCITGDDPQPRREQVIDLFQQTTGSVLVATLGALRESVTLHTARIVVLHDWHWVLTHLLQAEARVWRAGQRRACQSVWMMARGSIDEILARVLYEKSGAMQAVGIDKGREALEELGIAQLARDAAQDRVSSMLEAWL
jgi:SNF2 family DNA or RNA helicase